MSTASDALLSRLFAEGALAAEAPPLTEGEERVVGSTLSAGAARLYAREKGRWTRNFSQNMTAGKWLRPCSAELPPGVDVEQLREQMAQLLGIPEHNMNNRYVVIPEQLQVSKHVEPFCISPDDDRVALRGQRGLRATAPLPAGQLLGLLAGHVLTADEWETLKWRRAAGGDDKLAQDGSSGWLALDMALESFCVELTLPNYPNVKNPSEEPEKLFLSCFGYANILSLVNDSHVVHRLGFPEPSMRVDNCAFVELLLRGWPCVAVVTTVSVSVGEELLTSHGSHFWHYVADSEARLNFILNRLDPGGRTVAHGTSAPTVDLFSEIQDEVVNTPPVADPSASRHTLQMNGDAICAIALVPLVATSSSTAPPSRPAASVLNITGTTSGGDATASLLPLLASDAWDGRALVATAAPDAPPAQAARLASLAARMNNKGKAALVADCDCDCEKAGSGRRLFLLSPGRMADAVLSSLPASHAALPAGALLALVFAPSRKAAAATAPAATAAQAAGGHRKPEAIAATSRAEMPPPVHATATEPKVLPGRSEVPPPAPREADNRTWICATCNLKAVADGVSVCGRCGWLRGPAAAAAPDSVQLSWADAGRCTSTSSLAEFSGYRSSEEDRFAAVLNTTLWQRLGEPAADTPCSTSRWLPVRVLSAAAADIWRAPVPRSAVYQYGTLAAFLQNRPHQFAVQTSRPGMHESPAHHAMVTLASGWFKPGFAPAPAEMRPPSPPKQAEQHAAPTLRCPTCLFMNRADIRTKDGCTRCGFLLDAVPAAACASPPSHAEAQYVADMVAVVRSTPASRLPLSTIRLAKLVKERRNSWAAPQEVVKRYGTFWAVLEAHDSLFQLDPGGAEDPKAPAVRLRTAIARQPIQPLRPACIEPPMADAAQKSALAADAMKAGRQPRSFTEVHKCETLNLVSLPEATPAAAVVAQALPASQLSWPPPPPPPPSPRRSLEGACGLPTAKLPRIQVPLVSSPPALASPRLCAAVWSCQCGAKNCSRADCASCGWLELPRQAGPGAAVAPSPAEAAEGERFRRALLATLCDAERGHMTLRFLQAQLVARGELAPPALVSRYGTLLSYVCAHPFDLRVEEAPLPTLGYARYTISLANAAPPAPQR